MARVGIVATHPIQYNSPLFKALAQKHNLTVYYCTKLTPQQQGDAYGTDFEWDVDLLEGYQSEFISDKGWLQMLGRGPDSPGIVGRICNDRFDIFITMGWYYPTAWRAVFCCRRIGVPVYARGDSHLGTGYLWKSYLKRPILARLLAKYDGFLSVGSRFTEYLSFMEVDRHRIVFCPHCIDRELFSQRSGLSDLEIRNKRNDLRIPTDQIVFTFCGRFIALKGLFDFLEALRICRDRGLPAFGLLIGDGVLQQPLQDYIDQHDLPAKIVGFVNQSKLAGFYALSDCLILSSNSETWGIVVNEAFACGIPAIVSNAVGCAPDMIVEDKTGLISRCGDSGDLADKMHRIVRLVQDGTNFRPMLDEKLFTYSVDRAVLGIEEAIRLGRSV